MFADLLYQRPICLPEGTVRVIQDGSFKPPGARRVNSQSNYSADVRQRIMDLFDTLESVTVPIICAEIGFTPPSANRHLSRMESLKLIVKRESGRRGCGQVNSWIKAVPK